MRLQGWVVEFIALGVIACSSESPVKGPAAGAGGATPLDGGSSTSDAEAGSDAAGGAASGGLAGESVAAGGDLGNVSGRGGESGTSGSPAAAGRPGAGGGAGGAGGQLGGAAGNGGSMAGAGSAGVCDSDYPECCLAPDRMPCRDLPQAECAAREYCEFVEGGPYDPVQPDPVESALSGTFESLGCFSAGCSLIGMYPTCVYHPSNPSRCYVVPEEFIPDGWEEIFECVEIPAGHCTE